MKRDLELIRLLLLEVEKNENPTRAVDVNIQGFAAVEIAYHLKLLRDAGFIVAKDDSTETEMKYRPKSLTWDGHEFLGATRNNSVWRQVTVKLKDAGIEAPVSVIQQLAIKALGTMVGLGE